MNKKTAAWILLGTGLGVAGAIAWLGTRNAGPVKLKQYVELREGPLQEHLVTAEQLGIIPSGSRLHYPEKVCPGVTGLINNGFAPLWRVNDPQIMAMPGESAW